MGGARGSGDDIDPVDWLRRVTEPGDLLLTGESGLLSRAIQWGTRSHVSHTAIVRSADTVVEAYDFGLTPHEGDEGIFEHTFAEVVERSSRLDCLIVRRAPGWTDRRRARFDRALDYSLRHSPTFPTVGAGMACALVALTRPETRLVTNRLRGRLEWRFDRTVDWLAHSVGDGARRVHCSEVATRLYTWTGFELQFENPTLGPVVLRMAGSQQIENGHVRIHPEWLADVSTLPRLERRAEPSLRPQVDKTAGSKVGVTTRWQATGSVLIASVVMIIDRGATGSLPTDEREPPPDLADLILPADFERAKPFETVRMLVRRRDRWQETDHVLRPQGAFSWRSRLPGTGSRRGR